MFLLGVNEKYQDDRRVYKEQDSTKALKEGDGAGDKGSAAVMRCDRNRCWWEGCVIFGREPVYRAAIAGA